VLNVKVRQGRIQDLHFGIKKSRFRNQKTRRRRKLLDIFFCFALGFLSLKCYREAILKSQRGAKVLPSPLYLPLRLDYTVKLYLKNSKKHFKKQANIARHLTPITITIIQTSFFASYSFIKLMLYDKKIV